MEFFSTFKRVVLKRLTTVLSVLVIVSLLVAGCSSPNSSDTSSKSGDQSNGAIGGNPSQNGGEITVGVLMPLTGSNARLGQNSRKGIELAAEMINNNGGIKSMNGAKIKLEVRDATSDPTKAASAMQQLLSAENKPIAIIGAYASSLTMAAAPVSERAQIPLLTTSFTDDLTNRGFQYIFRIPPGAGEIGKAQLRYAIEIAKDANQPVKKVAIVYTNDAYGSSQAKGLKEAAEAEGLEITLFEPYSAQITDATSLASKIVKSDPDVLFPVSYLNDGVLLMRALSGSNIPVVGGVGGFITPDFRNSLDEDVNGIFSVDTSSPDMYGELGEEYQKRYGNFMTQEAHDNAAALYIIAQALEMKPTTDPKVLAETLHSGDFNMGAAGTMPGGHVKFDEKGANTVAKPLMVQWQEGSLVSVWPKDVAKSKPQWPKK